MQPCRLEHKSSKPTRHRTRGSATNSQLLPRTPLKTAWRRIVRLPMNKPHRSAHVRTHDQENNPGKASAFSRSGLGLVQLCALLAILAFIGTFASAQESRADPPPAILPGQPRLTQLSLAELGNTEVTTASKEPEQVWRTPAAIYVLTQDDIRRSGATSIPEVLRLVPGVEVARVSSNSWAVGIRGFGSGF